MKPISVGKGVWQITLPTPFAIGPVNVYIIRTEKVTLVDAGPKTEEAWETLISSLAMIDLTPASIDQIVLTHHHPDHTGLVGHFSDDVPIYAHWRCQPWLERHEDFFEHYNQYFKELSIKMGVPEVALDKVPSVEEQLTYSSQSNIDHFIDEGDMVAGLEEWRILYIPGHAYSHLALYHGRDHLLLAGDLLLEKVSSNAILEPSYHDNEPAPKTLLQYRSSLRKCLDIEVDQVLPGHGKVFSQAHDLILRRLERQADRRDDVFRILGQDDRTTFDIGKLMFPRVYTTQLDLVLSEVQGHLEWLLLRGDIQALEKDGVVHYRQACHLEGEECPINV